MKLLLRALCPSAHWKQCARYGPVAAALVLGAATAGGRHPAPALPVFGPARAASAHVGEPFLELERLLDGATVFESPIVIHGRTNPGRTILVIANDDDVAGADVAPSGAFWAALDLLPGRNEIAVLSFVPGDPAAPLLDADLVVWYEAAG